MSAEKSVEEIIQKSGNSFHCNAVKKLKDLGWQTLISPYYMDSASNKPREIDLVAEKAIPYKRGFNAGSGTINFKLFIECKYIPNKVVFWFDEKNRKSTTGKYKSSCNIYRKASIFVHKPKCREVICR